MLTDILRFLFQYVLRFGLMKFLVIAVAASNIFTFFLFFLDKRKAVAGKRRISERVLVLFAVFCGVGAAAAMGIFRHKLRKPKFVVAAAAGIIFTLIPVAHIVHGFTLGRTVRFVEVPFYSENWPAGLNGYRIAFMADIHMLRHEYMRKIIDELKGRGIDLLLLGGDFSKRESHYRGSLAEISRLETTDGIFGVDGNHDDHLRLFAAMKGFGMTPLDNSGLHVREGFFLAGVSDKWNREPSIETAIKGARGDSFVLLVSHNPDIARSQSTAGIDLVLSGHTHGGQITFFGYPFYLLRRSITHYGTRNAYGFTGTKDGAAMFVTSGVGVYYHIPRMFTRPEVVIFTMWNRG